MFCLSIYELHNLSVFNSYGGYPLNIFIKSMLWVRTGNQETQLFGHPLMRQYNSCCSQYLDFLNYVCVCTHAWVHVCTCVYAVFWLRLLICFPFYWNRFFSHAVYLGYSLPLLILPIPSYLPIQICLSLGGKKNRLVIDNNKT